MAKKDSIESTCEELLKPITDKFGVSIYDVEYVKEGADYYLRAYIDKEGGVTIDDCENVSRSFSDKLDEADCIKDAYILEVSSPGLGRTLKKDRHFENSLGMDVEVKLFKALDGNKEFAGRLEAFDEETITICTEENNELKLARKDLALVRLALDF